jgi:adenosylmethionine-8-amino-7-oxononanoate aminotransferase
LFAPPFIIEDDQLDELVDKFSQALELTLQH